MPAAAARGMNIDVTFSGGKRVDAHVGGFVIHTDQPVDYGGGGSAPDPFTLFLASLATCAGLYVLGFCRARGIPTDEVRLVEHSEYGETGRLERVVLEVRVPATFPAHFRDAVARAAAACKVKKTLADPPQFDITTTVDEPAASAA